MTLPTWITDAAENIGLGLKAMWGAFSPFVQGMVMGLGTGAVLGFGFAAWVLP